MPVFKIKNCNEYFGDLMKNLGKKIFTVFIVLLFCLSPLGAIDLNQGDNSSHLNDLNDGSHLNDLNGTDIEIKSINETDESIKGNDVESQKLSINDSNSSKSLSKKNVNIVMEVDDTTYGEAAVVKIWFKSSGFGTYYSPKVVVEDRYTHEVYTKDYFTKGYNEIKLRKDLDPSTYTVTFEYRGSSAWYQSSRGLSSSPSDHSDSDLQTAPTCFLLSCDRSCRSVLYLQTGCVCSLRSFDL